MMKRKRSSLLLFAAALMLFSCGKKFTKNPVDELIRDLHGEDVFTIILHDVDVEGSKYKHKYKVITEKDGDPVSRITPWAYVTKKFFWAHERDMGMSLANKKAGKKLVKKVSPAGYDNYVGNRRYGYWSGSGYWMWHRNYMYMSTMFYMMSTPIYRSSYGHYGRYGSTGSYYGRNGRTYGTYGSSTARNKPNFHSRMSSKSNWSKSASRSTGYSRSGVGSSRSSSGYRSSGGGSGK